MSVSDTVASAALELRLASQRGETLSSTATLRMAADLLAAAAEIRRQEANGPAARPAQPANA